MKKLLFGGLIFVVVVTAMFLGIHSSMEHQASHKSEQYARKYQKFSDLKSVKMTKITYRDDDTGKSIDGIVKGNQKVSFEDIDSIPSNFKNVESANIYETKQGKYYLSESDYNDKIMKPSLEKVINDGYVLMWSRIYTLFITVLLLFVFATLMGVDMLNGIGRY